MCSLLEKSSSLSSTPRADPVESSNAGRSSNVTAGTSIKGSKTSLHERIAACNINSRGTMTIDTSMNRCEILFRHMLSDKVSWLDTVVHMHNSSNKECYDFDAIVGNLAEYKGKTILRLKSNLESFSHVLDKIETLCKRQTFQGIAKIESIAETQRAFETLQNAVRSELESNRPKLLGKGSYNGNTTISGEESAIVAAEFLLILQREDHDYTAAPGFAMRSESSENFLTFDKNSKNDSSRSTYIELSLNNPKKIKKARTSTLLMDDLAANMKNYERLSHNLKKVLSSRHYDVQNRHEFNILQMAYFVTRFSDVNNEKAIKELLVAALTALNLKDVAEIYNLIHSDHIKETKFILRNLSKERDSKERWFDIYKNISYIEKAAVGVMEHFKLQVPSVDKTKKEALDVNHVKKHSSAFTRFVKWRSSYDMHYSESLKSHR